MKYSTLDRTKMLVATILLKSDRGDDQTTLPLFLNKSYIDSTIVSTLCNSFSGIPKN